MEKRQAGKDMLEVWTGPWRERRKQRMGGIATARDRGILRGSCKDRMQAQEETEVGSFNKGQE